jgi:hypothetical protein
VVVGANAENGGMGSATVFHWDGNMWSRIGCILFGEATGDSFRFSVSMSAHVVLVLQTITAMVKMLAKRSSSPFPKA